MSPAGLGALTSLIGGVPLGSSLEPSVMLGSSVVSVGLKLLLVSTVGLSSLGAAVAAGLGVYPSKSKVGLIVAEPVSLLSSSFVSSCPNMLTPTFFIVFISTISYRAVSREAVIRRV